MIKIHNQETDTEVKISIVGNSAIIGFVGSNHWRDILNVAEMWPLRDRGVHLHSGAYRSMLSVFWDIMETIPVGITSWRVGGHSLGGAQAQAFVYELSWLIKKTHLPSAWVKLTTAGAPKAMGRDAISQTILNLTSCGVIYDFNHEVYGNDPIPLLYPWFHYPGEVKVIKKRSFPWIDFNLVGGDHVKYWE